MVVVSGASVRRVTTFIAGPSTRTISPCDSTEMKRVTYTSRPSCEMDKPRHDEPTSTVPATFPLGSSLRSLPRAMSVT
jgi:hypothetical protein